MSQDSKGKLAKVVTLHRQTGDDSQLPLLPARIQAETPARRGTADLKLFVRTIDGHDYAVKTVEDHPLLPISEFLCYKLAMVCNLPVPYSQLINMGNGNCAFGSRFEGAVTEWAANGPTFQLEAFKDAAETVSAILAFDLFVGNVDRHRGNFLFRKNRSNRWVPLAIDYSRAMFVQGFPNDRFPMEKSERTQVTLALMKAADFWKGPFAVFSLDSLMNVKQEHIQHWFREVPGAWFSDDQKRGFLEWWQSPSFRDRINKVYDLI